MNPKNHRQPPMISNIVKPGLEKVETYIAGAFMIRDTVVYAKKMEKKNSKA